MTQEELQKIAVERVNELLTAQGLPTYTQLEDKLFAALTACHESVDMGKMLVKRLTKAEQTIKKLKAKSNPESTTTPKN